MVCGFAAQCSSVVPLRRASLGHGASEPLTSSCFFVSFVVIIPFSRLSPLSVLDKYVINLVPGDNVDTLANHFFIAAVDDGLFL